MAFSGSFDVAIDKLMIWSSNNWTRFDQKLLCGKIMLRIRYNQLLLTTETNVLETFNMNNKMKGVYKGDVLILIVSTADQQLRKLRFQIKANVAHCLSQLGQYFPVMSHCHDSLPSKNVISTKFRKIDEIFKEALTIIPDQGSLTASLPAPPDYENFVKLCLLDPSFPYLVSETAKILQNI